MLLLEVFDDAMIERYVYERQEPSEEKRRDEVVRDFSMYGTMNGRRSNAAGHQRRSHAAFESLPRGVTVLRGGTELR